MSKHYCFQELHETPGRALEALVELKEKIARESPEGLNIRTDDAFLIRFLRGRKFDVVSSKVEIDNAAITARLLYMPHQVIGDP
jgi:hypothetical protein